MSASGPSGPLVIWLAHSFTKDQNKREYLLLFGFSVTLPLPRKVPDVTKEQIYVDAISR